MYETVHFSMNYTVVCILQNMKLVRCSRESEDIFFCVRGVGAFSISRGVFEDSLGVFKDSSGVFSISSTTF